MENEKQLSISEIMDTIAGDYKVDRYEGFRVLRELHEKEFGSFYNIILNDEKKSQVGVLTCPNDITLVFELKECWGNSIIRDLLEKAGMTE